MHPCLQPLRLDYCRNSDGRQKHNYAVINDRNISVTFLATRSRSLFAIARPSVCRLSSVCLSSVTLVRPTQAVEIFDNICIWYPGHPLTSTENFYGDRPRRTPPTGELNTRGLAKYSDFRPIEGYILETVQDRR